MKSALGELVMALKERSSVVQRLSVYWTVKRVLTSKVEFSTSPKMYTISLGWPENSSVGISHAELESDPLQLSIKFTCI
jgi:hypothetical protein